MQEKISWYAARIILFSIILTPRLYAGGVTPAFIDFTIQFPAPLINKIQVTTVTGTVIQYDRIDLQGCFDAGAKGEPSLPVKPIHLLIPQRTTASSVVLKDVIWEKLPGNYNPYPRQAINVFDQTTLYQFAAPDVSKIPDGEKFPRTSTEHLSTQYMKGYAIACFNLRPVIFDPATGELRYMSQASIRVECIPEHPGVRRMKCRGLEPDSRLVRRLVHNPMMVGTYQRETNPIADYPYIIISDNSMFHSSASHNLISFRNHLVDLLGCEVYPMKTEIIYDTYSGADHQEQIREFLISAYESCNTQQVLIAGDADGGPDGENIVPVRLLYATTLVDPGGVSIASDMYYACLDGNYNNDGDSRWGELNDGIGGGDIDVLYDLAVGRIPVSDSSGLNNIVAKIEAFDNEPLASWHKKALMAEEFTSSYIDPGDFKEQIRLGSRSCGLTTSGFASDWTVSTLYEPDGAWGLEVLWSYLDSNDLFIVNHVGHGNNVSIMQLRDSNADDFANAHYMFAFSQACYGGCFDNMVSEGSYSSTDCIIEDLLQAPKGFAAFVANSRNGQGGDPFFLDGGTHLLDRCFFNAMFSDGIASLGELLAASKSEFASRLFLSDILYSMYELNLLGAPHMVILRDPLPTPTPSPTPTTNPSHYLRVIPSSPDLPVRSEDIFWIDVETEAHGSTFTGRNLPLMAVLDAGGGYWFWPTWCRLPDIDYRLVLIQEGTRTESIVNEFTWPAETGSGRFVFHFAVLNERMNEIAGDAYATIEITYTDADGY